MSRPTKIILVIIAIILLAIVIAVLVKFVNFPKGQGGQEKEVVVQPKEAVTPLPPAPENYQNPLSGSAPIEISLAQQARSIAERFGSYSTDNPFENLKDLTPIITEQLRKEFDEIIRKGVKGEFQRVLTYSTGVEPIEANDEIKRFRVPVQRIIQNSRGTEREKSSMRVRFVRVGEVWKADSIVWE